MRALYRRRHCGSTLRIMTDGGENIPHEFYRLLDEVDPHEFYRLLDREYQILLEEATRGDPSTEGHNQFDFDWSATSQLLDGPYCRWCRTPMRLSDSEHRFCEECQRWYDDAYCYWCWDPAGDWYPGWPDFHLALCLRCSKRYLQKLGPPWYPNHEQRCYLRVRLLFEVQAQDTVCMLPGDVCDRVAGFLAQPWRP